MGLALAVDATPGRPAFKGYEWAHAKRAYTGTGTAPMPMSTGTAPHGSYGTGYPVTVSMYRPCPTCPATKVGNTTVTATAPCSTCPIATGTGKDTTVVMTKPCPTCPLVPVTPTGTGSPIKTTSHGPFRPGRAVVFANSTMSFGQPTATGVTGVVGPPASTVIPSTAANGEVTSVTVPAVVKSVEPEVGSPVTKTAPNGQIIVSTPTAIPGIGQNGVPTESGANPQNPSTNQAGATSENPSTNAATNEAGSTSQSPATNQAGAVAQSPSANEAGATVPNAAPAANNVQSPAESPETFMGAASSSFRVPIAMSAICLALAFLL